ncbi:serine protease 55-like [Discoglossus pictus]
MANKTSMDTEKNHRSKLKNKANGNTTEISALWQAVIVMCTKKTCSGSILSEYWILTTAGCINKAKLNSTSVYIGLNGPDHNGISIKVEQIFLHEAYKAGNTKHDIALILLKDPILSDDNVASLIPELDNDMEVQNMAYCEVIGIIFRRLGEGNKTKSSMVDSNKYMKMVQIPVKASTCYSRDYILSNSLCVIANHSKTSLAEVRKGGSLLCQDARSKTWSQIGMIRHVRTRKPISAVYIKLPTYITWIENTTVMAGRPLELYSSTYHTFLPSSLTLSLLLLLNSINHLQH